MNEARPVDTDKTRTQEPEKKPYSAPQLTRHGAIEDVTHQVVGPGTSQPINISDRNLKENFASVDTREVLKRLARVQVRMWNYKSDSKEVRHIGPMAQNFAQAFGVGGSDRVIHTVDANGVTMAAIQALYQMVQEQNERIAALEAEVRDLREAAVAV